METVEKIEGVKIEFFRECMEAVGKGDTKLVGSEAKELLQMLNSPVMRKACSILFSEVHDAGMHILNVELLDQEAIIKASQIQGHARGMARAYEGLFELLISSLERSEE